MGSPKPSRLIKQRMSERSSSPDPPPTREEANSQERQVTSQARPREVSSSEPPAVVSMADTEPTPIHEGTPEPVVSEAPTELALDLSPAPSSTKSAATVNIKRVTLASATDDGEGTPEADIRKAESYVGYIIDGRYHIQDVLAKGGMGVVYRGRHRLIDKAVAIKILRPEFADNREITQRFLTEAQAASAIGNEHIVDITDYGELPEGATYIVMEFLEGEALSRRVAHEKRLTIAEIIDVARQAAEGLQGAHEAGIVHRDLKPDNIFLTRRGKDENFVKILDFGIAKVASSQNQITRAGHIFGTPHYMSPEQAKGDELDNRSDIYSMGVILYELVSGKVPFDGENPLGILTQHMYTEATPLHAACEPGRVDVGLEAIVSKCLLKEPWQRYGSMAELDEDLTRLQRGEQPLAVEELRRLANSPASLKKRLDESQRGRSRGWLIGLLLLGVLGGALGVAAKSEGSPVARWFEQATTQWRARFSAEPVEVAPADDQDFDLAEVAMVLSPIDARVYRGGQDLGPMPLTVRIRRGHRVTFMIKREGYVSERVAVDGTEATKMVELSPLPGTTPPPRAAASPAGARRFITITDTTADDTPADAEQNLDEEIAALLGDGGTGAWLDEDTAAGRDAGAPRAPTARDEATPGADNTEPSPGSAPSDATGSPSTVPPAPAPPPPAEGTPPQSGKPKPPTWLAPKDQSPAPGSSERPIFDSPPKSVDDIPVVKPEHPEGADEDIAE